MAKSNLIVKDCIRNVWVFFIFIIMQLNYKEKKFSCTFIHGILVKIVTLPLQFKYNISIHSGKLTYNGLIRLSFLPINELGYAL